MEYEGSIGFVMRKMKFFYCRFLRFRTFYGKKHDLSDKKFPLSRAVAVRKICNSITGSALSARKLKFWLPESFGPT
jgi:hypothetical protein